MDRSASAAHTDPLAMKCAKDAPRKCAARNPYWDGFILKHEGNCAEAIVKLRPIGASAASVLRMRKRRLGECFLDKAGLQRVGGAAPPRDTLVANTDFERR